MTELFGPSDVQSTPPPIVTKAAFAEELGLAKSRITQLVAQGMPVTANGRIDREAALAWYRENITPHRRKAEKIAAPGAQRAELDGLKIERERLELARLRGEVVDRAAVERAVFVRARSERDAWSNWSARVAPQLATELRADPAATFAALDRMVREQLAEMAATETEGLDLDR
jgi:phage terminase Nu1 subunit (DNA packaging protein)